MERKKSSKHIIHKYVPQLKDLSFQIERTHQLIKIDPLHVTPSGNLRTLNKEKILKAFRERKKIGLIKSRMT